MLHIQQQLAIALGEIGLSVSDFSFLTPSEWELTLKHYADKLHLSWEQVRTLAYCTVSPYLNKNISPADFMPLPWDKLRPAKQDQNRAKPPTAKEAEEIMRRLTEH